MPRIPDGETVFFIPQIFGARLERERKQLKVLLIKNGQIFFRRGTVEPRSDVLLLFGLVVFSCCLNTQGDIFLILV